jgi:hypothetical protein
MRGREPDADLVHEAADERRERARLRQRAGTWDEPPEFYDDDPPADAPLA